MKADVAAMGCVLAEEGKELVWRVLPNRVPHYTQYRSVRIIWR